ncbi:aldo/keto reductase [Streptomyces sp. URMC 123]|uniref:aldo/keto reductase n=1 Tax=Streptomyces sp. URMC 123 TaxID=3423403 RepID=UPI003F1D7EF4
MRYLQLGHSGVRVSAVSLGAFNFGGPTPEREARAVIGEALDAGINVIDVANVYQEGRSEEIVGRALGSRRDDVLIATKCYNEVGPGPNDRGNSALAVKRECERSLRRLGTDHIDLYYLHRHDPHTPVEETLGALEDLVAAGKVRYIGTSTVPTPEEMAEQPRPLGAVPSWRIVEMLGLARGTRLPRVVTEQSPYNLLEREIERDVLPLCAEYGVGLLTYSPLAMGLLSERFLGGAAPSEARFTEWFGPSGPVWDPTYRALEELSRLAGECGMTLPEFAHAWSYGAPGVTSTVIGPRTLGHLRSALAAYDTPLDAAARAEVDRIVPPGTSLWFRTVERSHRTRAAGASPDGTPPTDTSPAGSSPRDGASDSGRRDAAEGSHL